MVCFLCGEGPKSFSSPENYGDWRSARSDRRARQNLIISNRFQRVLSRPLDGFTHSRELRGVDGDVRKRTRAAHCVNHLLLLFLPPPTTHIITLAHPSALTL